MIKYQNSKPKESLRMSLNYHTCPCPSHEVTENRGPTVIRHVLPPHKRPQAPSEAVGHRHSSLDFLLCLCFGL